MSRLGRVLVNHLGFHCRAEKRFVVVGHEPIEYEIQNMALNRPSQMAGPEDFAAVVTGKTVAQHSVWGKFSSGDFSSVTTPGIYRIVLPATAEHSFHFKITDGVFAPVSVSALGFVHAWRSGNFANAWRGATNLDDGKRSDNGICADFAGGWYDAGDSRKWMVHSNLPALAFMEADIHQAWDYAPWEVCAPGWSPWLLEALWGLDFIIKMQDPATGMFYEDVAGGLHSRKLPGMAWFYENHSGCYADNADNRFTDNVINSGDERTVRIQYNHVAQYTSIRLLAKAAQTYAALDPERATKFSAAAVRGWQYSLHPDSAYFESTQLRYENWTAVRSWRALAALEMYRLGKLPWSEVEKSAKAVLENYSAKFCFWLNESGKREPYRALLHSAQPLIALAEIYLENSANALAPIIFQALNKCFANYILPLSQETSFGIIPFGLYSAPASDRDLYREWHDGYLYRFFMPNHHLQKINHGLSGHWSSWAHGLALLAQVIKQTTAENLAWRQLHWLTGANLHNSCLIDGYGYNTPMAHSRLFGQCQGGMFTGFIGTTDDLPELDLEGDAQWNSCEYWMTTISNTVLALNHLIPKNFSAENKLGRGLSSSM